MQVFNFESRRWLSCNTFGCAPSPREGHSAVIYKNHMIIFGGQGDGMNFRDCYSFSFEDYTWRYLDTSRGDDLGRCTSALSTSGSFSEQGSLNCLGPSAQACVGSERFYHTAVVFQDEMYVFGGCDDEHHFGDLLALDFNRLTWHTVMATGPAPSSRYCHASVVYYDSMFVFGGCEDDRNLGDFYEFNFTTREWKHVYHRGGLPPSPRYGHVCSVDEMGNFMLLYGGCIESMKYNTVHMFNFDDGTWHELQLSTPPLNLAGHTCVYFDGNMYVFGGCNDDDSFSEVFELELEWEWVMSRRTHGPAVYSAIDCSALLISEEEEEEEDAGEDSDTGISDSEGEDVVADESDGECTAVTDQLTGDNPVSADFPVDTEAPPGLFSCTSAAPRSVQSVPHMLPGASSGSSSSEIQAHSLDFSTIASVEMGLCPGPAAGG
mmetsp:Transcript_125415/g.217440  ORF Transcript_125415/g.217440 Transcript_125415/m.217440 type:complete len:434 (-) Transcript_125415:24-1325(-)